MKNTYIPSDVDRKVKVRHFFECAWCGERLTERHHIIEFSQGGEHTEENLILLCPNCHTRVHKGEITDQELLQRKSTHAKGDRISGGIQFELTESYVKLGNAEFRQVPILIMYNDQPIISLRKTNNEFFLSASFYNKEGELVFWMSSNRYWANSDFIVQSRKKEIKIFNNEDADNFLRIWEASGCINVEGKNFINGALIDFDPSYIRLGDMKIRAFSATKCSIGIRIGRRKL